MRAIALSMLSFLVFFVFVGEAIGTLGIGWAYVVATIVTVGSSLTTAMLDRWLAQSSESRSPTITKTLE